MYTYVSFFCVRLQLLNGIAAVLKRNNKPKVSLPSKLISLPECQLQQQQKTVRDEVTTSGIGKKWYNQYKKERVVIRKYSTEMLRLPCPLCYIGYMCTLR